jgi:hypothetical protein
VSNLLGRGLVDPGGGRQRWWPRRPADEPLRRRGVGGLKNALALGVERLCLAVVHGGRGHQADPGVAVGVVVPVKERAAEPARVLDRVKAVGELGPVLQRLELRLRVGVVSRGVWSAVRLCHAEVGQQERDRL